MAMVKENMVVPWLGISEITFIFNQTNCILSSYYIMVKRRLAIVMMIILIKFSRLNNIITYPLIIIIESCGQPELKWCAAA